MNAGYLNGYEGNKFFQPTETKLLQRRKPYLESLIADTLHVEKTQDSARKISLVLDLNVECNIEFTRQAQNYSMLRGDSFVAKSKTFVPSKMNGYPGIQTRWQPQTQCRRKSSQKASDSERHEWHPREICRWAV